MGLFRAEITFAAVDVTDMKHCEIKDLATAPRCLAVACLRIDIIRQAETSDVLVPQKDTGGELRRRVFVPAVLSLPRCRNTELGQIQRNFELHQFAIASVELLHLASVGLRLGQSADTASKLPIILVDISGV